MNVRLFKAVLVMGPALLLFLASWRRARRRGGLGSILQLGGAGCLVTVVLTHVAEAGGWLTTMGWGRPDSPGHYLDLTCAVLGLVLVPLGYVLSVRPR